MKHPLFMALSLALLAALDPPMWHLWTVLNTANANFYYAITLLWGSWQVSCAQYLRPQSPLAKQQHLYVCGCCSEA